MTGIRTDPTLSPTSPAGTPPLLGAHEAPVALAASAGPGPFLLEGARVAVLGSERRGVERVIVDGRTVAAALTTDAGIAANVVCAPATMRRELVGARTTLETVLALPALPLVAVQWTAPEDAGPADAGSGDAESGDAGRRRPLTVELTLLPGEPDVRYHLDGARVRASGADADRVVDAVLHPPSGAWSASPAEGGGVRVCGTVEDGGPVTLLVAGGSTEAVSRAMAAAPHLSSHEIRAAAAGDPAKMDTLVVRTGVPEIDHAVVWATARTQAAVRRTGAGAGAGRGTGAPDALFWAGVGALAVGDHEGARTALERIPPVEDALGAFLAARYALATGDQGPALARYAGLDPETLEALRREGKAVWAPWQDALARLADALRNAVPEQELDGMRNLAARPPAGPGAGGLALPMAGGAPNAATPANATWPGRLLGGRRGRVGVGPPPEALAHWAALVGDRVDEGWAGWRRSLAEGLSAGPDGRGSWDAAPDPWSPGAAATGIVLGTLAYGLLGIEPDEPSGRLGLSPALPSHVTRFAAKGIRVGEASMSLTYEREGRTHHFGLEPLGGRVPVMAIFSPSVPESAVSRVLVDGAPADLRCEPEGSRTRLEVQLPLDAVRTVDVIPV